MIKKIMLLTGAAFACAFLLTADYFLVGSLASKKSIKVPQFINNAYFPSPTPSPSLNKLP